MTRWHKTLLLFLLLTVACSNPGVAEERLTTSKLRSLGVEVTSLQPITFSHDSKTLAAFDRAPFEEKEKGTFYRLWFFQIERDGKFGKVRSVDLPIKNLQQGEFTPDDSSFVVLGDRGTTFLNVDLDTLELEPLMKPEWGESGFRADPAVLWAESGKLFVTGFPYDKERFVETRTVATVNPEASQQEQRFERGPDISTLEKGLDRLWFTTYLSDSGAFFGQKYPQTTILSYWDGTTVTEFDRAWKCFGFWCNAGRLLYAARRGEGQPCELVLYNAANGQSTVVGEDAKEYRYIFLSRDGSTILTSQISDTEGRLYTMYAHEDEDWELKPVAVDRSGNGRTIPVGWMRLSSDGRFLCHIGAGGMILFPLF